jgi:hypothetical protein
MQSKEMVNGIMLLNNMSFEGNKGKKFINERPLEKKIDHF